MDGDASVKARLPLWPNDQTRRGCRPCAPAPSRLALHRWRRCEEARASFDKPLAIKANFAAALNNARHRFSPLEVLGDGAPAMGPPLSAAQDDRDLVLGEAHNLIMWRARRGAISGSSPRVRIPPVIGPSSDLALACIR
jgi:hypothetical protein